MAGNGRDDADETVENAVRGLAGGTKDSLSAPGRVERVGEKAGRKGRTVDRRRKDRQFVSGRRSKLGGGFCCLPNQQRRPLFAYITRQRLPVIAVTVFLIPVLPVNLSRLLG